MIYIVVPTFNRVSVFNKFIEQLDAQTNINYKLIVVDHGKQKTHYQSENSVVIEDGVNGRGWSYAINVGIRYVIDDSGATDDDYILVINDDVLMESDYIESVYNAINKKPNSLIGSGCYDWDTGETLNLNMKLNKKKAAFMYKNQKYLRNELKEEFYDSDVLKGRGTILPIHILKNIGIYDEKKLPHYRADHELAWRAKKNYYDVCVSGKMWLGATLDSPHTIDAKKSFRDNYRNIFSDMISIHKTKDLWNYSFCCFNYCYGFYFFIINYFRSHIKFFVTYRSEKKNG